jgi:ABC-type Fe3+/spermidine/putrescine transport system ATPase subunit
MLHIDQLSLLRRDGLPQLDGVSLRLAAGEVAALLGPSGSGKTTLLRLVAGFEAPSQGSIAIGGRQASGAGRVLLPPQQRGLSLALQDATLFPHMDALDNVAFAVTAASRAARRQRAGQLLSAMGLPDAVRGRPVATLSGGEAQRVALARALGREAGLLLLDEPFGNVDRLTRQDLIGRLREHLGKGVAALIVTHDPADAEDLASRVLLLRQGRLVGDGESVARLRQQGRWERELLG